MRQPALIAISVRDRVQPNYDAYDDEPNNEIEGGQVSNGDTEIVPRQKNKCYSFGQPHPKPDAA